MSRFSHRRVIAQLLSFSGLARVSRRLFADSGIFVLMFHGVAGRRYETLPSSLQPALTRADLESVLGWLRRRFHLLTPAAALAGESGILLTFDDGFANNAEQALPALEAASAPAIFFVTSRHVDDPKCWLSSIRRGLVGVDLDSIPASARHDLFDGMSEEQLVTVARHPLITVGGHSASHPFLTRCVDHELELEVSGCRDRLRTLTGQPVEWFAYPTGDYDRRVATAVAAAGFRYAVAETPIGFGQALLEIPRIGIYEASPAILDAKLSGLFRRPWSPPA